MISTFTGQTLPIIANYAQVFGDITIPAAIVIAYYHHKCHSCWKWGRHASRGRHSCRQHVGRIA